MLDPKNPATENQHRSLAPVIVDWDAVRDELEGARVSSVINGEAWWGINSGAKKSLDTPESYLGKAVASGRTEVKALHTVSEITYDPSSKLYTVTAVHTDEAYNTLETLKFMTPNLIMSAGSIGTTKLLLRARDRGTLPNLNGHVGTLFSNNGNTGGFAFVKPGTTGPANELKQGGPAGVKILDTSVPTQPDRAREPAAAAPDALPVRPAAPALLRRGRSHRHRRADADRHVHLRQGQRHRHAELAGRRGAQRVDPLLRHLVEVPRLPRHRSRTARRRRC